MTSQRRSAVGLGVLLLVTLWPSLAFAQPVAPVGAKATGLQVLPPWTLRLCPTEPHAAYTFEEAKDLARRDNDCALWRDTRASLTRQVELLTAQTTLLKQLQETYEAERTLDAKQIQELVAQLKVEITEKNKYKYQVDYRWIWITAGAAVAATGLAFGAGVWLAR